MKHKFTSSKLSKKRTIRLSVDTREPWICVQSTQLLRSAEHWCVPMCAVIHTGKWVYIGSRIMFFKKKELISINAIWFRLLLEIDC